MHLVEIKDKKRKKKREISMLEIKPDGAGTTEIHGGKHTRQPPRTKQNKRSRKKEGKKKLAEVVAGPHPREKGTLRSAIHVDGSSMKR